MTGLPSFAIRLHSMMDARVCPPLASCAEKAGFRTVWFAENPFQRGMLPAASASAVATETIEIGIGVFNPFNRHPSLMAMEIAALDELSAGRAAFGIGVGVPPVIARFTPFERPLAAMRDAVTIARGLLAGKEVTHRGKVFSADGIRLAFPLVRDSVPIQIAAMGPQMLRLAGEIGDGILVSNMCPPDFTERVKALAGEGAARAGRAAPSGIVKYLPCQVDADPNTARRAIKPAIAGMLGGYLKAFAGADGALSAMHDPDAIEPALFSRTIERLDAGENPADALDDRFVDAYGIAGTAEDCIDQIARIAAPGVTQIALSVLGETPERDIAALGAAAGLARG